MKKLIFSFLLFPFLLNAQESDEVTEISNDVMHNKGFFNLTKISFTKVTNLEQEIPGFTTDLETSDTHSFALQSINGYFLNPYVSLGLGVGLEGFISPALNTFPVFADLRVYLENDYSSPFIFVDYGTLLKLGEEFKRGNMFAVGAGYKFSVGKEKRTLLVTDLSFSGRNISRTDDSLNDSDDKLAIRGITLGVGVIF